MKPKLCLHVQHFLGSYVIFSLFHDSIIPLETWNIKKALNIFLMAPRKFWYSRIYLFLKNLFQFATFLVLFRSTHSFNLINDRPRIFSSEAKIFL